MTDQQFCNSPGTSAPGTTSRLPVICLTGATASGKTDLAMKLATYLPIDLISVDSGQVYRGMDIGTAKPEAAVLKRTPHGLIDIRDIDTPYSAADFCRDAESLIQKSIKCQRIPLLVGGTLFYFSALLNGLPDLPPADASLRTALEEEAERTGWAAMYDKLLKLDPSASKRISPGDRQRILRALEINLLSGEPVKRKPTGTGLLGSDTPVLKLCLFLSDRAVLHRKIAERVDHMLELGFVNEVARLREQFPGARNLPAMRSIGYQQVWSYLEQEIDHAALVEDVRTATRRLAKRQLTWMRNEPGWTWFDALGPGLFEGVRKYLAGTGSSLTGDRVEI